MKRWIIAVLAVLLLLSGCGRKEEQTPGTAQPTTEPAGFLDPTSPVQTQTNQAVLEYPLPETDYVDARPIGNKLLLIQEQGALTLVSGVNRYVAAAADIGQESVDSSCFTVCDEGVSYYDSEKNQVILLNKNLRQQAEIDLPADIQGHPVYCPGSKEIFYLQGQELRTLNVRTGVARLVLTHRYKTAQLLGAYLDGDVIALQMADVKKNSQLLYVQGQTGQILWETDQPHTLQSWKDRYSLYLRDEVQENWAFGSDNEPMQMLNVQDPTIAVLAMDLGVSYRVDEAGVLMDAYALTTGKHTSQVLIPDVTEVITITGDGDYIWVLGRNGGKISLYRWDIALSGVTDEMIYTDVLYTSQEPDQEGLTAARERAAALQEQYGVELLLWDEVDPETIEEEVVLEYKVPVINGMLDALEQALEPFPQGFFAKTKFRIGLRVCLLRSIEADTTCKQYFKDGTAYILLTAGGNVQDDFLKMATYVIDSQVLGNSRDYDLWTSLNPAGFAYLYENPEQTEEDLQAYLQEGSRSFVDQEAMQDPLEDRRRIFLYAIGPENGALFASDQMQRKLCRLCEGIREAYDLEEVEEGFLWEQYLTMEMDLR